MKCSL